MGLLDYADSAREKLLGLLGQMPISQIVRGDASVTPEGLKQGLLGMPVFDRNAKIEDQSAFWNPAGLLGTLMPAGGFKSAQELSNAFSKERGIATTLSEGPKELTLSRVVVPKDSRGQGLGSEFMGDLVSYADQNGKTLLLSPSTDFGGTSVDRLKKFYKQFGLIENKGKNKDFSISESMYRPPK